MSERKAVKAWVTKYSLAKGVYIVDAKLLDNEKTIHADKNSGFGSYGMCFLGNDWAEDEEGARVQVKRKAQAALRALEKRRKKLEALLAQVERGELPMAPVEGQK